MQPSTDSFIKSFKQCANAWIRQRRAEFGNDIEARYGWKKVLLSYFVFILLLFILIIKIIVLSVPSVLLL
jgi:hypothetical protein